MFLSFDEVLSDSPYIERIWCARSERAGSIISISELYWEMVVTKYQGGTTMTIRGPETKGTPMDVPAEGEWLGITFKLGTFMPHMLPSSVMDLKDVTLPTGVNNTFWLGGSTWQFPTIANVDIFVGRLMQKGVLICDPVIDAVIQGNPQVLSPRAVQYRYLQSTGLTQRAIRQIKRARHAAACLKQNMSILDTVYACGYSDQPHLTRAMKRYIGVSPTQIKTTPIIGLRSFE